MPVLGGELLLCDFKKLLNRNIWPQFFDVNFMFWCRESISNRNSLLVTVIQGLAISQFDCIGMQESYSFYVEKCWINRDVNVNR